MFGSCAATTTSSVTRMYSVFLPRSVRVSCEANDSAALLKHMATMTVSAALSTPPSTAPVPYPT